MNRAPRDSGDLVAGGEIAAFVRHSVLPADLEDAAAEAQKIFVRERTHSHVKRDPPRSRAGGDDVVRDDAGGPAAVIMERRLARRSADESGTVDAVDETGLAVEGHD